MNFYNSFDEMYKSNTKQDMSVFNTVRVRREYDDGSYSEAEWDYGDDVVWFYNYPVGSEDDDEYEAGDDFGLRVDGERSWLAGEMLGVDVANDDAQVCCMEIEDKIANEAKANGMSVYDYVENNQDKVNAVVKSYLAQYNLKPIDGYGDLDQYCDYFYENGGVFFCLNHYRLEAIDNEKFERDYYKELGNLLAQYVSGARNSTQHKYFDSSICQYEDTPWEIA